MSAHPQPPRAGPGQDGRVRVPQVDVNDTEMLLVEWRVGHGERIEKGAVLCVLETAKATHDLESEFAGVVHRAAEEGATVSVGQVIAAVARDLPAAAALATAAAGARSEEAGASAAGDVRATPKAEALAREHGVALADVPRKGSLVKEKDVLDFLAQRGQAPTAAAAPAAASRSAALPELLRDRVESKGALPRHKQAIARHLAATQAEIVFTTVECEVALDAAQARLAREADSGANVFHLVLLEVARALTEFPLLASFRLGDELWSYREPGIAFTVVDTEHDHRLVTPVIARAGALSLAEIAEATGELALEAYRGTLRQEQLLGGAFTVSMLTGLPITRFTALQNRYQSAVLAVGTPRALAVEREGGLRAVPHAALVLSYDHGVCDGFYAGAFLTRLKEALERA